MRNFVRQGIVRQSIWDEQSSYMLSKSKAKRASDGGFSSFLYELLVLSSNQGAKAHLPQLHKLIVNISFKVKLIKIIVL